MRIWRPICAAPFVLAQAFAKALPDGLHGSIVNVIDQRVLKPTPQFLTYSLSKAGLYWLTTTLAQALAPADSRQCRGAGPDPAQRAAERGRFRPPARGHRSWAAAPRRKTSARPCAIFSRHRR